MAKLAALAAVAALAARGVAGDACYDKQVPVRSLQSSRVPELMDFDEWALKFGKVRLVGRLPRACATRPVPLRVSAVSPPPPRGDAALRATTHHASAQTVALYRGRPRGVC